jgi:4-hydroxy-tetrahydrodipicolinate synthase
MNFAFVRDYVKLGLSCFMGNADKMLPALVMGAIGCIDWGPCLAPEPWVELWNAYQAGDMEKALAAQDRGIEVVKLREIGAFHQLLKAGLSERLGIDCGAPRAPGQPLSAKSRKELRRRLTEMGYIKR